jgi:hypothetical protein
MTGPDDLQAQADRADRWARIAMTRLTIMLTFMGGYLAGALAMAINAPWWVPAAILLILLAAIRMALPR